MREGVSLVLALIIYFVGMTAVTFWCGYVTGELLMCFKGLDGFGSIAGVIFIVPIYLALSWLLSFVMK